MTGIQNISRDEAKALLKELDKVQESLDNFEPIDTTIYDSIKRRNEIDQQQDNEDEKNDGNH